MEKISKKSPKIESKLKLIDFPGHSLDSLALAFKLRYGFINALFPFGSELGMAVGRLAVGKASRKVSTTSMEIYGGQRRR